MPVVCLKCINRRVYARMAFIRSIQCFVCTPCVEIFLVIYQINWNGKEELPKCKSTWRMIVVGRLLFLLNSLFFFFCLPQTILGTQATKFLLLPYLLTEWDGRTGKDFSSKSWRTAREPKSKTVLL